MNTSEGLFREFASPSMGYRIAPIFRFNDEVDAGRLAWQVRSLKEKGFGGLFLYCETLDGGPPFRFLSEEWFRTVELFARACAEEGLDFWIYDEQDWPSGTAGGQLLEKHPELGWKYLFPEEHDFEGPADICLAAGPHPFVAAAAWRTEGGQVVEDSLADLTARVTSGELRWRVPAGRWTVAIYTMRPGIGGFENGVSADLMDPAAGAAFVEMSYRAHLERVRKVPGAVLKGFFTDEATFSMALYHGWKRWADQVPPTALPWTPKFLEEFRSQHGYDARPLLPLMHRRGGRQWVRFRVHFFQTCCRLMREGYYAAIDRFCRDNGVLFTGHLNGEEIFHRHLASQAGSIMTHYRHMHIPGIDWIWPTNIPLPAVTPKFAASVSHRMGLERTMCESFAASGWGLSFQQMRWIVNWEHVNGINLQVPICYKYSLRGPSRTTFFNPGISYQQPYWDHFHAFADYEARLCVLASGGGHVAQVALYYPADDMCVDYDDKSILEARSKAFAELGDAIRHGGYDFDIVDDEAVLELSRVKGGRLVLGEESHEVVVLPPMDTIRYDSLEKLCEVAEGGGALIFVGGGGLGRYGSYVPTNSVERGATEGRTFFLAVELLGEDNIARTVLGDAFWHPVGRGRVGFSPTPQGVVGLLRDVFLPDVQTVPPAQNIVAYHRHLEDGDLYLLMNHTDRTQTVELTLRSRGIPEAWNPLTGEATAAGEWRPDRTGTWMRIHFHPQELIPIFLRGRAPGTGAAGLQPRRAPAENLLREIPLPGPFRFRIEETMKRPEVAWNFTQDADGWTRTLPPPVPPETIPLGDWCKQGLAAFSGIGHYSCEVDLGELPPGARVVLDLGRVAASAEVFVNESSAGIVLFEPYRLDITRVARPGRNALRIAVANTLSNYYSQFAELEGKPLDFGGDLPQRRVSGLLGPVLIRVSRREE